MSELRHYTVSANGIRIHVAECGEGPAVLMVHGFPESWYSWRHQLPALAQAGYRALAIDVRGYGRSSKPVRVVDYRMMRNVADLVGLLGALDLDEVTLLGHDWGAPIVYSTALLRPDLLRGLGLLSVPYTPPAPASEPSPLQRIRALAGDQFEFYVDYFQEPGRAEAEIEEDLRRWLLGFYWSISGEVDNPAAVGLVERGKQLRDRFSYPDVMPEWLSEADLDVYAREFEYSGLFGPLCRYRNVDRDFEDLAAFAGRPIELPSLFVGGSKDGVTVAGAGAIAAFPETLPGLKRSVVLEGCGHWIQQERPKETNELVLSFLNAIH